MLEDLKMTRGLETVEGELGRPKKDREIPQQTWLQQCVTFPFTE
jgi:hypothetical protein